MNSSRVTSLRQLPIVDALHEEDALQDELLVTPLQIRDHPLELFVGFSNSDGEFTSNKFSLDFFGFLGCPRFLNLVIHNLMILLRALF